MIFIVLDRCVTFVSPAFFQKLGKNTQVFGKNALIVVIYGLNFSLNVQYLSASREKTGYFSVRGLSISSCR